MNKRISITRQEALLTLTAYAALVLALPVLPRFIPAGPVGVSAAAAQGYNTEAAFWTVVAWALTVIGMFAWRRGFRATSFVRRPAPSAGEFGADPDVLPAGRRDWLELAAVFLLFVTAYCPLFLAPYAPFSEDTYFLTALGRMACGQQPYRDFGFLYGPSMIYLPWGWAQLWGGSLVSYYSFLALLQGLQFAALMAVLQRLVPVRAQRYFVFVVLLTFLVNNLFGLNYDGTRWLVPALVVLLAAVRPHDRAATGWCAVVLGFHLTYSHEYAIAALLAVGGMHAVLFWQGERSASVRAVLVIGVGSVVTWGVLALLLVGDALPDYIRHAREVVNMMALGHAGFAFYWTANSLALFALLTIACASAGISLAPPYDRPLDAGARFTLAAVLFTLVAIKSGLNRADLWHLNPNFLPLLIAFLLPVSSGRLMPGPLWRRLGLGLVVAASLTFLVGIAPMGSLIARSYVRGVIDVVSGRPPGSPEVRGLENGFERERADPDDDLVALGLFLKTGAYRDRPVLFYGRAWALSARLGVCPAHYKLDDLMYSEFTRRESDYLERNPEAVIVIGRDEFVRLYGQIAASAPHSSLALSPMKQVGRWLSTVHYEAAETEARLQNEARTALTGRFVRAAYTPVAEFNGYVVLARR